MTRQARRMLRGVFYVACALVGALSLAPSAALPPLSIWDKAEHAVAYALLGLLGGASSEHGVARVMIGLAAFGAVIEVVQAFSPGRSPDALDVLADCIGACIGCGAALAIRRMALARQTLTKADEGRS